MFICFNHHWSSKELPCPECKKEKQVNRERMVGVNMGIYKAQPERKIYCMLDLINEQLRLATLAGDDAKASAWKSLYGAVVKGAQQPQKNDLA